MIAPSDLSGGVSCWECNQKLKTIIFSVRGKFEDITTADLQAFAAQNDINNPSKYIKRVKDALKDFRSLASANGVASLFIDIIESRLRELSPDVFAPAIVTSA